MIVMNFAFVVFLFSTFSKLIIHLFLLKKKPACTDVRYLASAISLRIAFIIIIILGWDIIIIIIIIIISNK